MDGQDVSVDRMVGFLTEEVLDSIRQVAAEVLVHDEHFDLVQKLTPVWGYTELIAEQPNNLAYHIKLRRAAERMLEFLRRTKSPSSEMTAHLEKMLS
jgi:hypothetical protein